MRRLIVNADDFGLTAGVNRAIVEAHQCGVVTSATLMARGAAFAEAAELARQTPTLGVGCHVVLADGEPVEALERVESLVPPGRSEFHATLARLALAALRGRVRPEDIEAEAVAQIRRLQQAGLAVTHLDTHKHAHMLPQVLEPLLRAARTCGVPAIRNPFAPLQPLAYVHLLRRPRLWKRYGQVRALRGWQAGFRQAVAAAGLGTTEGSLGVVTTGALDEELFTAIAGSIPEGTWEFVCHPGYNDRDLDRVRTRLRESRARELEVLTSQAAREALEKHGVQLISYRQL